VPDALKMARGLDLDLVEVAPMANPPVCRIMDYGKFRYEEAQKAKEARKKSSNVTVKEVKFRPKIGKGDFDTKVRHLIEFIEDGHKVKVTLQFRGREMAHPELGSRILDGVITAVGPAAKVENEARLEGRNMSMVLAPDKKAQEAIKKAAEEAAAEMTAAEAAAKDAAAEMAAKAMTAVAVSASDVDEGSGEPHAEDEDEQDRSEAVQEDGHRQTPASAGDAPAPVREEVVDAD
jgi:translation initiation factor IF-3